MSIVVARDCTGSALPGAGWAGQMAGYSTGTSGIPWTPAQFAAHPGAVVIDQTPAATAWDRTADVDDCENGAVELPELAARARERMKAFAAGTRPGQRSPAVYASASNITAVVNALIAGGVSGGVGLWVAEWGLTEGQAAQDVISAAGPFPIIGWQFASLATYDLSVFSGAWLHSTSVRQPVPPPPPAGPPYRHLTQPGQSLADIAAARNTTPTHLLQVTAGAYTGQDIDILAGHHLPGGVPFYSSNT